VKDARTQQLPLVGGGIHDWGYILLEVQALHLDQEIGNAVWFIGCLIIIISVTWGLKCHSENPAEVQQDQDGIRK